TRQFPQVRIGDKEHAGWRGTSTESKSYLDLTRMKAEPPLPPHDRPVVNDVSRQPLAVDREFSFEGYVGSTKFEQICARLLDGERRFWLGFGPCLSDSFGVRCVRGPKHENGSWRLTC